jgi:DNA repair exonuclease SbcCD ATPase subunit
MASIFGLPITEQFDCGHYRGSVRSGENAFYATWERLNGTGSRGLGTAFPTIDECREYLRNKLDRMTTETRARSLATRTRRREQKIAQITKDFLLGKHIGNRYECAICGRHLSDPPSIARAIGSECWPRFQDHLAREVPRCTENIERLSQSIAELEKQDLTHWQAQTAQRYSGLGHITQSDIDKFAEYELRRTHDTIRILKRQLADAELLRAAAVKWATASNVPSEAS